MTTANRRLLVAALVALAVSLTGVLGCQGRQGTQGPVATTPPTPAPPLKGAGGPDRRAKAAPVKAPAGKAVVTASYDKWSLKLAPQGEGAKPITLAGGPGEQKPIAPGTYVLKEASVERKAPDGGQWHLDISPYRQAAEGKAPQDATVDAAAGQAAEPLAKVEPVTLLVNAKPQGTTTVALDLALLTADGHRLVGLERNGTKPSPPKWRVLSAKGEAVASGSFEFG